MKMETSFDVSQHPSEILRRDHRNDRYRKRQAQHAEQAHDLERDRKERRIDKASGKIGHRFLLGVVAMSLARPARAPCDGVHLPTGFSLLLIAGWRGERMVRRRAARLARRLDGEGQT